MKARFFLPYAARHRLLLAAAAILLMAETVATLAIPWLAGRASAALGSHPQTARQALALILVFLAVVAALRVASGYASGKASARILSDMRVDIYDHLQRMPLAFHQQRSHGDLFALVTRDVAHVAGFVSGAFVRAVPVAFTAMGALILMVRIDVAMAVGLAATVPVLLLAVRLAGRRLKPLTIRLEARDVEAFGQVAENLTLVSEIKSHVRERTQTTRYRRLLDSLTQLSDRQHLGYSVLEPALQLGAAVAVIAVLWFASPKIASDTLQPGELVAFLLYAALLTRPVAMLAVMYGDAQRSAAAVSRLQELMELPGEPLRADTPSLSMRGAIELHDLHFAYPGREELLRGVSASIQPGEMVAITGANGSGKSTLARMLVSLQLPSSGRIALDGVDVSGANVASIRAQVVLLAQPVVFMNASVRDNIAFGRDDASQDDIALAARQARAHDFIETLPQGYDTPIGDNGEQLSGGQRQRLALARALVRRPVVLILDEATSMLDAQSEIECVRSARAAAPQATILLITHRREVAALADRVLVLDKGLLS